jgi:NhaA family Na+:H+ antiporter
MPILTIKKFLKAESAGGIVLLCFLFLALFLANSPLEPHYKKIISSPNLFAIVNDGLMALFFLLLALEIKREMLVGELRNPKQVILPIVAATGGVIVPAVIYLLSVGIHDPALLPGWAIPVATDVALALGLLSLLGKRVPASLKIFLAVLAIADDLIVIIIIALFYTQNLSFLYLGLALGGVALLVLFNRIGIARLSVYMVLGFFIWLAVLKSGVHATLAGVMVGFCVPYSIQKKEQTAFPLNALEIHLRPWVTFSVLPLFVLVNAGVSIAENDMSLLHSMPLGIALALFFGKQIGIFSASWLIIKTGMTRLPSGSDWLQLYGVAVLAGIGFTMSMFISNLAFRHTDYSTLSHLGILMGSGCAAVFGLLILFLASLRKVEGAQ